MNQNKVSYNFGKKGWSIIGFEIVLLFFMTGMTVDGLNIIVPNMAAFHGWDADLLLSISTPAGIIALFLVVFWGKLINKFGLKRVTVVTMFLAAISVILYGYSINVAMYTITLVLLVTFINAFALTCGFAICANWFPTQKGIVMGFVTIGMNLASAIISLILNSLTQRFNIAIALAIMGIVIAIVAVLVLLFVKATPEEAGCLPDNDPEVAALIHKEEQELKDVPTISYKEALTNPKVWVLGIGYGCFGLATVGIMSQLTGFFQDVKGFELQTAIYTITIAAVIGMVGSWLWGVVDQKIGTKITSVIFGFWVFYRNHAAAGTKYRLHGHRYLYAGLRDRRQRQFPAVYGKFCFRTKRFCGIIQLYEYDRWYRTFLFLLHIGNPAFRFSGIYSAVCGVCCDQYRRRAAYCGSKSQRRGWTVTGKTGGIGIVKQM